MGLPAVRFEAGCFLGSVRPSFLVTSVQPVKLMVQWSHQYVQDIFTIRPIAIKYGNGPDLWLAAMGSMLTAVLAAAAAFQLGLPDRKAAWALLPLPAVLVWIGASGMGCLRPWSIAEAYPMPTAGSEQCLIFILSLSLPLSLLLIVMLRRSFSSLPPDETPFPSRRTALLIRSLQAHSPPRAGRRYRRARTSPAGARARDRGAPCTPPQSGTGDRR